MNLITLFFLPAILLVGAITSYEDIKKSVIRNIYLILGICYSAVVHIGLFIVGYINQNYIFTMLIYVILAFILGILLWYLGIWNAGDAKLFICYTSLIPIITTTGQVRDISFIALLTNTVIPIFIYLLVHMMIVTTKKQKINALKKIIDWKYILLTLLTVFSLSWVIQITLTKFNIVYNVLYGLIGIMLLSAILQKLPFYESIGIMALIAILRVFVNQQYLLSSNFILDFIIITLIYICIRIVIFELGKYYILKKNIRDIKENEIPVQAITTDGIKMNIPDYIRFKNLKYIVKPSDRLDKESIASINKLYISKKLHFNTIYVQQTIPFAIHMFIGAILTILSNGTVMNIVQRIL